MRKRRQFALGFLGMVTAFCLNYQEATAQELASISQPTAQTPSSVQSSSKTLKNALEELKTQRGIYFMFNGKYMKDKRVDSYYNPTHNTEEILIGLLKPLGLTFKKVGNIFVIIEEGDREVSTEIKKKIGRKQGDNTAAEQLSDYSVSSNPLEAAANITVTGRVTDNAQREGLPGVSVLLKGTTTGTVTDANGNFSISVPDASANGTLIFSFIGYVSQEVPLNGRTSVEVSLAPDIKALEEVVVVGYGTQKRSDLTGSIASVKGADVSKIPVPSLGQALQGQVAGVEIVNNSNAPGANFSVRIRGISSINSSEPLYVVDGQATFGGVSSINTNDIESVEVLKDASAGAIYGARAANGVVIITTKKGKEGPLKVNFESYYGTQSVAKKLDILNADQFRTLQQEAATNGGLAIPPAVLDAANTNNTNWQDLMFRTAPIQNYTLGLSGGGKFATFNISASYFRQDGIVINTDYQRANLQINTQGQKGRFKFGESILVSGSSTTPEAFYVGGSLLNAALRASPLVPLYETTNQGGYGGPDQIYHQQDVINPIGYSNLVDNNNRFLQILGNVYGEFEILKGLSYRLNLGTDLGSGLNKEYTPQYILGATFNNRNARLRNSSSNRLSWLAENTLRYTTQIGQHDVTGLVGYSEQYLQNNSAALEGIGLPFNDLQNVANASTRIVENNKDELSLRSYFVRVNYGFANKYLLTATLRRDGSSNFSANNRYGNFPSASVGWVVSEENFLKNVSWISFLKVRASYGLLGNQNIGPYNYQAVLNTVPYVLGTSQANATGAMTKRIPADSKWETTAQADVGIELGLLRDKLFLTADYFDKQTEDMLIPNPNIPAFTGRTEAAQINAGGISNRGFELALTYKNKIGDFQYNVSGNFTTYKNEITSLGNANAPLLRGDGANTLTKSEVGSSLARFYTWVVDGLYQNDAEIDKNFAPSAQPGDIRFKDLNEDGELNDKDRTYTGSPLPKFTYGFNLSIGYKGFDLSALLFGVYGNDIYNTIQPNLTKSFNTITKALDRWTPQNPNTTEPRVVYGDPNQNYTRPSNRFLEKGSFLRMRNVTIGYRLPGVLTNKMKLSNVRFYVTGQNLFTITKYSGYDPEAAMGSQSAQVLFVSSNLLRGYDRGIFPAARTFIGGVQIEF